jgi:hypothetical protein
MTDCEIATTNALLRDRASASKSGVEGRKSGGKPPHSKKSRLEARRIFFL